MHHAKARGLARIIVVNKIDGGNCRALVEQLRETFGPECLPINLPAMTASPSSTVFSNQTALPIFPRLPRRISASSTRCRDQRDGDGSFSGQGRTGLSGQELHDAFEQCLREGHLVPVCFVSARTGAGVKELLTLMEKLLPNPKEGNRRPSSRAAAQTLPDRSVVRSEETCHRRCVQDRQRSFVGKLSVFRMYQGTIKKDTQLFIDDGKKPFKVGHLFKLKGKDHLEIDQAIPGDIARWQRSRKSISTPYCMIRTTKTNPSEAAGIPASDVRPRGRAGAQGQEQKLAYRCTSSAKKIPVRYEHNRN